MGRRSRASPGGSRRRPGARGRPRHDREGLRRVGSAEKGGGITKEATSGWRLQGTLLIACNCDYGCPCNFNARPTHGDCEGAWSWHVEEGCFGDVRLDGLAFSVFADWPQAIHDGGGKAVAFVDERADGSQREAIASLVRGEAGGPWAIFAGTYELRGPEAASYEVSLDGLATTVRISDVAELELATIRNPVTGAEIHPGVVLPEGLVVKKASLGTSSAFRIKSDVKYDHSGKYAAVGPFEYSGP